MEIILAYRFKSKIKFYGVKVDEVLNKVFLFSYKSVKIKANKKRS